MSELDTYRSGILLGSAVTAFTLIAVFTSILAVAANQPSRSVTPAERACVLQCLGEK